MTRKEKTAMVKRLFTNYGRCERLHMWYCCKGHEFGLTYDNCKRWQLVIRGKYNIQRKIASLLKFDACQQRQSIFTKTGVTSCQH